MFGRILLFAFFSAGFLALSWPYLRNPRTHGFYRFFVFETILLLVILNGAYWFRDPFSPWQILSWIFLLVSGFLVIHGFYLLRSVGKMQAKKDDTTARLVKQGAFRYIRHPLYASLFYLGLGIFFKNPTLVSVSLAIALLGFVIATARVEEAENLERFGQEYGDYMKETKMLIPFLF